MPTTVEILSSFSSTLRTFGVYEKFCKDPASAMKALTSSITDFIETTTDELNDTLGDAGITPIALVIGEILASKLGGLVAEWEDTILNEYIFGKVVGSMESMLSMIMSAVPGAIIFFKYQAVKNLAINLQNRITLSSILERDVSLLKNLMLGFEKLFVGLNEDALDYNSSKVLKYLNRAIMIINIELNKEKHPNKHEIMSSDKIKIADYNIDKAIDILSKRNTTGFNISNIFEIHRRYHLITKPPSLAQSIDPTYWASYFADLLKELLSKDNLSLRSNIIQDLFPIVPKFIKFLLAQSLVANSLKDINEKTPTLLGDFAKVSKGALSGIFGSDISSIYDDFFSMSGLISTLYPIISGHKAPKYREPEFFRNESTKNLTLKDVSQLVDFYEIAILTLPALWSYIEAAASIFSATIIKSRDLLKKVKNEVINSSKPSLLKKQGWVQELVLAKGFLKPVTSEYSGATGLQNGNIINVNGLDLAQLLESSEVIYKELSDIIYHNKTDANGDLKEQPFSAIIDLTNKVTPSIVSGAFLFSKTGRTTIAQLIGLEFLYNKQYSSDLLELNKANEYISLLRNSQTYKNIEKLMEQNLGALKGIDALSAKISSALNGDLSKIINISSNAASIAEDILTCAGLNVDSFFKPVLKFLDNLELPGFDFKEVDKIVQKVRTNVANAGAMGDQLSKIMEDIKIPDYATPDFIKDELKNENTDILAVYL